MKCKLKEIRTAAKKTQIQLSNEADVSRATISKLENIRDNDDVIVTMDTLIKLAHALDKKVSDIFLE